VRECVVRSEHSSFSQQCIIDNREQEIAVHIKNGEARNLPASISINTNDMKLPKRAIK
jgi:hypothetical protein